MQQAVFQRSGLMEAALSRQQLAPPLDNLHAIRDLTLYTKNASLQVIVLNASPVKKTREGRAFRTLRVADPSGSIMFTLWNDICLSVRPSDILQLVGIGTNIWQGEMQLKLSPKGSITKVGEFCMLFSSQPDCSVLSPEVQKVYTEQKERTLSSNSNESAGQGDSTAQSGEHKSERNNHQAVLRDTEDKCAASIKYDLANRPISTCHIEPSSPGQLCRLSMASGGSNDLANQRTRSTHPSVVTNPNRPFDSNPNYPLDPLFVAQYLPAHLAPTNAGKLRGKAIRRGSARRGRGNFNGLSPNCQWIPHHKFQRNQD